MWRSFPSIDRARLCRLTVVASLAGLIALGCAPAEEKIYELYDPIEMGPWTFSVTDATERTENRGGNRFKTIFVSIELQNYKERHEKPFDDFLNGRRKKSVMTHPKMWLVGETGKKLDGWLSPKSGGSMRSERWQAQFLLAEFSFSEDSSDTAKRYLDKHPADFLLEIQNPDRREGQPRGVKIRLP
jgi:hypothetical protein